VAVRIGSNLLLKHRRGEARRLRASARMAAGLDAADRRANARALDARLLLPRVAAAIEALPAGEREALLLFAWEDLSYQSVAEALELPIGHRALAAQPRARAAARTARARREKKDEAEMKPVDLVRKLRRDAAFEPAALDRGKELLMQRSGRRSGPSADRRSFPSFRIRTSPPQSRSWSARSDSARSLLRGA